MSLLELFNTHGGRLIDKWEHYFPIYERYFEKFRFAPCKVLEIGVCHGGSLQLWKEYFENAQILGADIDERCLAYTEERIEVVKCDQSNRWDLKELAKRGPFDIIIDDGSHVAEHQLLSYEELYPTLADGGVYLIEDCHQGVPLPLPVMPSAIGIYQWVLVAEKHAPSTAKRCVVGAPSRPLNADEIAAYGDI